MNIKKQIIYWVPVYIYIGVIFYFSSQSNVLLGGEGSGGVSINNYFGYLAHSLEYFILGVLFFRGFLNSKFKKKSFKLSLVLSSLYALSDEVHQLFVVGRTFSFLDLVFDFLGVIIGILIISFVYRFLHNWRN